jgi:leucyl-tRNA synthetase
MRKFLERIYRLSFKTEDTKPREEFNLALAKAAAKIGSDAERFKFNTAISALMILVRDLEAFEKIPNASYQELLILLAPFAPHLAESLWNAGDSIHQASWPHQDVVLEEEFATVIVQLNSKKKGEIRTQKDATEDEVLLLAREVPAIAELLATKGYVRIIYVPGRILNVVTGP